MDSLLYESNQYAIPNIHKPPHILQLESTGTGLWNQVVQTRSFSIDNSQNISVHLICLDNSGTGDFDSLHNKGMVEILNGTGNVVYSKLLSPGDNLTEIPNTLSAGNYTLRVTSNGSVVTTKVYQTYFPQTIDYGGYTNQVTGGLRVKSVLTANPGKQVMVKRYYYGSIDNLNVSSLYYAPTPVYKKDYLTRYMCLFGPAGTAVNYLYCQHTALYSNSQANLFAYQSSPVSYETVTESIGENFEGGGTQTKYMVGSDAAGQVLIGNDVLNAPQSNFSQIMNGKPKEELIFKKDGQGNFIPLRKTIYKYKIDSNGNKLIEGYFVTQKYDLTEVEDTTCVVQPGTECGRILDATLDAFDMIRYDIMSKWVYNDSLIEISYDQNGQNPITRLTVNYYENQQHLQLTRTETYDSKNNVIKTVMKYPGDFAGTAVYDSMVNRHIISPIIELTGYTNGTQLSDLKTNYYNWGNGNFAPQSITRSTYNNPAQSEGQFDLYDAAGNILQYTPKDGVVTSVIWGHKGYLPVAKITGANYSQVLTQMLPDTASLQNLTGYNLYSSLSPLQSSLPSSMVTIYTYKNLVGITSLTDQRGKRATYEYDAMNRLKLVRDQDSNIVRKFQYNYASAQPDIPTGVYFNSQQTGTYYSQACIAGYSSGPITYVVPAGSYYSYISQADANAKAQAEISEKGQYFVNTNSSCYMVFINDDMSQNFTRNNCSSGYQGSTVTYSVDIGTYTSIISKEDANNQALADITANGQSYANTHGTCSYIYHNVEKSGIFTRNNCGSGYTGGQVAYTVPAGTYSSLVSQADADQKAQDDINANGQNYANTNGSCTAICTNCTGENKKCINGTCATGLKVYTSSVYIGPRHYQCTYHYEWSDGSWSQDYTEDTTAPCLTAL
jgi:YD repeat-containing protein